MVKCGEKGRRSRCLFRTCCAADEGSDSIRAKLRYTSIVSVRHVAKMFSKRHAYRFVTRLRVVWLLATTCKRWDYTKTSDNEYTACTPFLRAGTKNTVGEHGGMEDLLTLRSSPLSVRVSLANARSMVVEWGRSHLAEAM